MRLARDEVDFFMASTMPRIIFLVPSEVEGGRLELATLCDTTRAGGTRK